MSKFIHPDFLLQSKTAQTLYHEYAKEQPIIDFHNHLPPKDIAENRQFSDLHSIWLEGDHYKWRALRSNGISEKLITGNATPWEKFEAWANTVPYTLRNPLYHWTHLELNNPFDIHTLLDSKSAKSIWDEANRKLATPAFSTQSILKHFLVEVACTTDDPCDDLAYHKQIAKQGLTTKVFPTFRPDPLLAIDSGDAWRTYIHRLEGVSGVTIMDWDSMWRALTGRMDFFASMGCKLSDHGLPKPYGEAPDLASSDNTIKKVMKMSSPTENEVLIFRSTLLHYLGVEYHKRNWTMQIHFGPLRNTNTKAFNSIGRDAGFDTIGDEPMANALASFMDHLATRDALPKTILYNINPKDTAVFACMCGNFQGGELPGKIQYGSGWWFLDQKKGMEDQLEALSLLGLLSRFVGMLTDSRSFLSFSRHEYFRRILCNILGSDMENGLIPNDIAWVGEMVKDISYRNAKNYFGF